MRAFWCRDVKSVHLDAKSPQAASCGVMSATTMSRTWVIVLPPKAPAALSLISEALTSAMCDEMNWLRNCLRGWLIT